MEGERRQTKRPLPKRDAFFNSKKSAPKQEDPDCVQSEVRGQPPSTFTHAQIAKCIQILITKVKTKHKEFCNVCIYVCKVTSLGVSAFLDVVFEHISQQTYAHKSTKTTRNYNLSEEREKNGWGRKKERTKERQNTKKIQQLQRRKAKLFVHAHKLQQLMYWK